MAQGVVKETLDDIQGRLFSVPEGAIIEEPEVEAAETPEKETEEVVPEKRETEVEGEPELKEYKNPHAYIRVLERDKSILEDRMTEVLGLLNNLSKAERSEARESAKEAEDAGVAPDPKEDPLGALYFELKSLKDKLTRIEQKETEQTTGTQVREALKRADQLVATEAQANPEVYTAAMIHLGQVLLESLADDNPKLTQKELLKVADDTLQAQKLKWMHEGKNPGVEFMRMSRRYGFRPPEKTEERKPVKTEERPPRDPKVVVQEAKDRESKTRAIVNRDSESRPSSGRDILKMDVNTFQRWMLDQQQKGNLSGRGGTAPVREILRGK